MPADRSAPTGEPETTRRWDWLKKYSDTDWVEVAVDDLRALVAAAERGRIYEEDLREITQVSSSKGWRVAVELAQRSLARAALARARGTNDAAPTPEGG